MAIFRTGKRVGPFDIRTGISRGDLENSAYHKTDSDPRLRRPGNYRETTIGRFRAAMGRAEGYARPARFAIRVILPSNIEKLNETVDQEQGFGIQDSIAQVGLRQLEKGEGHYININCDSVSMPAHDLQSEEHTMYGPPSQIVTGHGFTGTIGASFYADKYLRERQFFEAWQKMCVGEHTHKANYYDSYIGKMHIYQLGSDNEISRDMPTYAVEAMEVYPSNIGSIEYGYARSNELVKITVSFAYKYWRNMGSTTQGLQFGRHTQAPVDIKKRNTGLFGMLPPELQRMGKDVFSQGRTVLNPIGRIFKGKVFPPFT